MKSGRTLISSLLLILAITSCTPVNMATPVASTKPPTLTPTIIPKDTLTNTPTQTPIKKEGMLIEPYQDVRSENFSKLSLGETLIKTFWFNQSTIWSTEDKPIAQNILELGKNPGLGVRELHAEGITGKGITVAIIDQNMLLDHPEFKGKIVRYHDVGTDTYPNEGSMHGPAVTSLLVGEHIGTAPDAIIYYVAAPSWKLDSQYFADALNWLIDENAKLPAESKIRVVSVSATPSGEGSPFTKNQNAWDAAYQRAMNAGILVLDCTHEHGITAHCYYDLNDPDNVARCIPGIPGIDGYQTLNDRILIPTSLRTSAEEYHTGSFSYQFTGQGGLSWSVPYLSGVLAMGWQINPELTGAQLVDMVFASAYTTENNQKVIDPKAFIEMVKLTVSK